MSIQDFLDEDKTNTLSVRLCGEEGSEYFSLGLLIDALPIVGYLEHGGCCVCANKDVTFRFDTFRGIFDNVDDDLLKQCAVYVDTDRRFGHLPMQRDLLS